MTIDLVPFFQKFAHFSSKDIVITPNRRISAWLNRQLDSYKVQCNESETTWQSINIIPLSTWLDGLYEEARDIASVDTQWASLPVSMGLAALVLSPTQEKAVWEQVIANQEKDWIKPEGAAKQALQAWAVLNRWSRTEAMSEWDINDNTHLFQSWLADFKNRCNEKGWISQVESLAIIKDCIEAGILTINGSLSFYGFDELEPAVKGILSAIEKKGGSYCHLAFENVSNTSVSRCYQDKDTEIEAALQWLVTSNAKKPKANYCVVAPDIADDRALIERVCKRLLQPTNFVHPGENTWRNRINVSAGSPLGSFGVVADAVLLLEMLCNPLVREGWGTLMRSPYWIAGSQRFSRCSQFSDTLVEAKAEKLSVESVTEKYQELFKSDNKSPEYASRHGEGKDPLLEGLEQAALLSVSGKKSFSEWSTIMPQLLYKLGWPGKRSLSSQDYQLKEKFFEQIHLLALFDEVAPKVSLVQALRRLKTALSETMFQIKTEQAPMQVLGVLEASGLHFDGIWVLSSDDQHWPASPAPNPFISQHLQRAEGMPNASAEKELAYASFILNAFTKTSSSTIFSWHLLQGDSEFNISPLLAGYPVEDLPVEDLTPAFTDTHEGLLDIPLDNPLVYKVDDIAGELPEGSKVKGGASIIKAQAQCPFRAFALYRLGAKSVDPMEEGLSPAERGELLHGCLENFWRVCVSSERLHQWIEEKETLLKHIESSVSNAITSFCESTPGINEVFLTLEKTRLERLVLYWLVNVEAERTSFIVTSLEQSETLPVKHLEVTVKADRIDLVEGQYTVIVDYKTGQKSRTAWKGERPDDPQLPLYAIKHRKDVDGVVFAVVKQGESAIKGEVDDAVTLLKGRGTKSIGHVEDWPKHMEGWDVVLSKLAEDFSAGVAKVDPKKATSCDYCELTPLCRRKEESSQGDGM